MKFIILLLCLFFGVSCMKSKEEYRMAIDDVQREQAMERQEEMQREEVVPPEPLPVDRSRGSNDKEGMGMYE